MDIFSCTTYLSSKCTEEAFEQYKAINSIAVFWKYCEVLVLHGCFTKNGVYRKVQSDR